MTLLIPDISSHNTVTSWPQFLGAVDGVIVKISEGVGYAWPGAPNALAQARGAGKLVGAYHFASAGDPVAEADYFLSKFAPRPGEVIVLDWEPASFTGDADAWGHAWCQRVISRTGVVPMLYLNHYYGTQQSRWPRTRSLGCALWAAWYGANTGRPLPGMPSFAPWPGPAMWQFTSNGRLPGLSGVVDLNQFYGTAAQWRAYGTPGGAPLPTVQEDEMRLIRDPNGTVWRWTDTDVTAISDTTFSAAAQRAWGGLVDVSAAELAAIQADAAAAKARDEATLTGYGARIERIDEGAATGHGPWGYGDRIEAIQTALAALPAASGSTDVAAVVAGVLAGLNGAKIAVAQPSA